MDEYFHWLTEESEQEEPVELLQSNFQAMIDAIIVWVPDPQITE